MHLLCRIHGDQLAQGDAGDLRKAAVGLLLEEFLCVIKNVDADGLNVVAEKLRNLVQQSSLDVGDQRFRVTVSVGGTVVDPDDSCAEAVSRADQAMYESKRAGRNKVTIVNPERTVTLSEA